MSIVLDQHGRTVGTGYNGAPPGMAHCVDGGCPRGLASTGIVEGQDYANCVAVHAEANALMFSDRSARIGGTLYVNACPCFECAKLIAGSGLCKVVIVDTGYSSWSAARALLVAAGLEVVEYSEAQVGT